MTVWWQTTSRTRKFTGVYAVYIGNVNVRSNAKPRPRRSFSCKHLLPVLFVAHNTILVYKKMLLQQLGLASPRECAGVSLAEPLARLEHEKLWERRTDWKMQKRKHLSFQSTYTLLPYSLSKRLLTIRLQVHKHSKSLTPHCFRNNELFVLGV